MARGRPRRPPLRREQVIEAAFTIADQEGLGALSMRRLAGELGVEASSLYHYVSSRDDVLDGIVVRLRAQVSLPSEMPDDWAAVMEMIFVSYAEVLTAHPHLVPLAGRHVETDPEVNGLMYLVQLGFSVDEATEVWQSVHALTIGFALLASAEVAVDTGDLTPTVAQRMREWRPETYLKALHVILRAHRSRRLT